MYLVFTISRSTITILMLSDLNKSLTSIQKICLTFYKLSGELEKPVFDKYQSSFDSNNKIKYISCQKCNLWCRPKG